jgi:hypothetical protein
MNFLLLANRVRKLFFRKAAALAMEYAGLLVNLGFCPWEKQVERSTHSLETPSVRFKRRFMTVGFFTKLGEF